MLKSHLSVNTFPSSVPLQQVSVTDSFWGRYMELVRTRLLPYQWKALNDQLPDAEPSHCLENFRLAAGLAQGEFHGCVFQDSDVAKWLESTSYVLAVHPDEALESLVDEVIELLAQAQQPDGYLNTYYIINGLERRWTNIRDCHELYCAGHLLEAAVAYFEATGKRRFLDIMLRYVDHIASVFGPAPGQLHGYPGHEEIELALVRLYRLTGDAAHLALASYFIDTRGQSPLFFEQEAEINGPAWDGPLGLRYYQAQQPVRQQQNAEGHAVRAMYLYCGMASVARETDDEALHEACRRLWDSAVHRQMYITGALGSSVYGEAFTLDYDLPNDAVYGETCASIGLAMFARRMLELEPRGEYGDVLERVLYNGVISGMSLEGERFFYVNPLEVRPQNCRLDQRLNHVKTVRQKWFGCACCPPNLARLSASIGHYIYTQRENTLFVNLYIASRCTVHLGGVPVTVALRGNYPWDGKLSLVLSCPQTAQGQLALRIPGWCRHWKTFAHGRAVEDAPRDGYLWLEGPWNDGDEIRLTLDMPVERMEASLLVRENIGRQAIMRGPLVYCLEEADNGAMLHCLQLPRQTEFSVSWEPTLLEGVATITASGYRLLESSNQLYRAATPRQRTPVTLRWIPYYAWNNRGEGEMLVWISVET